jgi:hypothetical protein
MKRIVDFLAAEETTQMSPEKWLDRYRGFFTREDYDSMVKYMKQRTGLKAMGKAAGAGR